MAGANSPASLASRPVRYVLCDEIDRYPGSAGTEGDPVNLAFKRATTFWNRKRMVASTPTIKGYSRIERLYEMSDMRKFYVPCPHCGEYQTLKWEGMKWPEGKPALAYYQCTYCKKKITDRDKPRMLRDGEWRAEGESKGIAGFWINEIYSPFVSFAEMVRGFLEARKDPETLKTWINTSLGESWEDKGETITDAPLLSRRETYPAEVPMGAAVLTAGVDIQINRIELEVVGWGKGRESWGIEKRFFAGDPDHQAVWDDLWKYIQQPFKHQIGIDLHILCVAIDSGFKAERVYSFVKPRQIWRIYAIKGMPGSGRILASLPNRKSKVKGKVDLITVGVDTAKDYIYGCLKIAEHGPGYCHFPMPIKPTAEMPTPPNGGYDADFFNQLTSEKAIYERGVRKWIKKSQGRRNEALDCRVYATAALNILNPTNLDGLVDELHKQAEEKKEERKEPQIQRQWPQHQRNWVKGE